MAVVAAVLLSLPGCASVGPTSIQAGRLAYSEVINQTDAQQTLLALVRNRYDEPVMLLGVSGVAASMTVSGNASVSIPFGNALDPTRTFSGGVTVEESPTVSYTPVQGRQFMVQLMSPLPLEVLVPLTRTAPDPAPVLTLLASRINDLPNPVFLPPSTTQPDPRFVRALELIGRLRTVGRLAWASGAGEEATFSIVIRQYAPDHTQEVREFLKLLGLPQPQDVTKAVVLPVTLAVEAPDGISVETRSVFELIQILSAAIEVPEEHLRSGVVAEPPPLGWAGRALRIHSSAAQPDRASVAVKYRDVWYYIDDTDRRTKNAFRFVHALISMVVGEAIKGAPGAPVLTVPVR